MAKKDLNSVTLVGRLTADPRQDFLPNGTAKTTFSIANNYYIPNKDDQVSYFDIVSFGKLAETCGKYLTKGKQIAVSGELRQNRWTDKEGQKRSKVEILLQDMQMLGSPGDGGGGGAAYEKSAPKREAPEPSFEESGFDSTAGFEDEDDVPF